MFDLVKIRKELHSLAELSGKEVNTRAYLKSLLEPLKPDELLELSGSLIAVFDSKTGGENIAFRADIDALPISETGTFAHRSKDPLVSHLCGHDGHSTILLGLAEYISLNRPESGKAVLIFQSAEETGEGAKALVKDERFLSLGINKTFGFHNLPGLEESTIYLRKNSFASASVGLEVRFKGKTSHSSQPENGISPVPAITRLIEFVEMLKSDQKDIFDSKILITVVGMKAGNKNFGIAPDKGEVYMTIRAYSNSDMHKISSMIEAEINKISSDQKILSEYEYFEYFPAVENCDEMVSFIDKLCSEKAFSYEYLKEPYFWSEDFAFYKEMSDICFFGIGSGIKQPHLHALDYDFNDLIIYNGKDLLKAIYEFKRNGE
ncbi:MAG: amidohydrolase [Candidatus Delongbacteria bacterium]|nr:amidohydrolase [Candidatus Delongbacteria bacterium]